MHAALLKNENLDGIYNRNLVIFLHGGFEETRKDAFDVKKEKKLYDFHKSGNVT